MPNEAHSVPIIPIAVFSHDAARPEASGYQVGLPSHPVLHFQFQTIQLRQIPWRKYLRSHNPVAAALMARMKFRSEERPRVKLECLRVLLRARPDPTRLRLLSGFIDTYLPLNPADAFQFEPTAESAGSAGSDHGNSLWARGLTSFRGRILGLTTSFLG